MIFSYLLASSLPYYHADPSQVLKALQSQASDLSECQVKGGDTVSISLHINPLGSPTTYNVLEAELDDCLKRIVMNWKFPEHKEDIAVLQFSLSPRNNRYYLLPGSYIETRIIPIRYWMELPTQAIEKIDESEHISEENVNTDERKP